MKLAAILLLTCAAPLAAQESNSDLAGAWNGAWTRDGDTLAVTMRFERSGEAWRGGFDSERLRVEGIPFQEVALDPPAVRLRVVGDRTTIAFEGSIDGDSLTGSFTEGEARGRFAFVRVPVEPPFLREEEIRFRSGTVELAGTLVRPSGDGPHPTVVFLHGSGPEGRWASGYLARWLARRGIAALIYDKRGVGGSTGDWRDAGFEDLAADAAAAVAFARSRPGILPGAVGIHGHSQGGTIAPLAAVRSGADFVIASAAAGVSVAETEVYSIGNSIGLPSLPPEEAALARSFVHSLVDVAYHGAARARLDSLVARAEGRDWLFPLPDPDNFYWAFSRRIADFDAAAWWRQVDVPVLLLYGSADERVAPGENRDAIVRALEEAHRPPVTVRIFDGADHTFRIHRPGDVWPRTVAGYPDAILEWWAAELSTS